MPKKRETYWKTRLRDHPHDIRSLRALSWVYLALNRKTDAINTARQAVELLPLEKDAVLGSGNLAALAEIQAQTGEVKEAVENLRKLLSIPAGETISIARLKIDPVWDPIRNDPGFQQLLTMKEHSWTAQVDEDRQLLRRTEAAQRLQGCGRLCGGRVARHSGGIDFLPAFNAPQWAMQIIILILVLGFPIALVFSWAFEITPEGIVRESEAKAGECDRASHGTENCRDDHRVRGCGDGIVCFSTVARAPGKGRPGSDKRPAGCRNRAACHSVNSRSSRSITTRAIRARITSRKE